MAIGEPLDPQKDIELLARQANVTPFVTTRLPDGLSYVAAAFDAVVDKAFDLGSFPFDRQDLTLAIEARDSSLSLALVPDQRDSTLSQGIEVAGWDIVGLRLDPAVQHYETGFGYRTANAGFTRRRHRRGAAQPLAPADREVHGLPRSLHHRGGGAGRTAARTGRQGWNADGIGLCRGGEPLSAGGDLIGFDEEKFGLVDQISLITFSALIVTLALSVRSWRRDGQPEAAELWQRDRVQEVALLTIHGALLLLVILIAMI